MDQGPTAAEILVLDFGAQYSLLIARRIRELGVYCEVLPGTAPATELARRQPRGIVLSGGPASVYQPGAPAADRGLFDLGIPILGICYGMQLMARQLGGRVEPAGQREYGGADLEITGPSVLWEGIEGSERSVRCWMSHGDRVEAPPPGFEVLARTGPTPVAAMADPSRKLFGVQFHPEVSHTPWGKRLLHNFVYGVCGCRGGWSMGSYAERAIRQIREQVGEGRAVCALSGGVDSATAAVLVARALGDRLTCIFVDHGLLRKGEAQQVIETFRDRLGLHLIHVDASERFLRRLEGVEDPERKRKTIGEEFIRVFEEQAARVGTGVGVAGGAGAEGVRFLVQGTLYPDVIESGGGHAATIKSHHNVGGLPEAMQLQLVEPLRFLFKDEVRRLALELGIPEAIVWRHPFPGPGLAIRVMGPVTREKLQMVREADAIVREEVERAAGAAGLPVWQAFAVLTGTYTVGVMGDARTYGPVVAVRCVHSEDGMTADWVRLPHEAMERIAQRITSEVPGVNRVVYDITSKPPATIEWE